MVTISTDSFWTLCKKSQLLPETRLREARRTEVSDSRAAARLLVERGDLTRWQAGQLLAGRSTFVLGGYLLLERLGKGGMGSVYRARQLSMSRVVAVKLLASRLADNLEAQARFVREMQALAALNHPNIVSALDAGQELGLHYLVMEYLPGRDLAEYLKKFNRLPIAWSCECIRQAALGLQHAHEHGYIHRDIKPSNLLVAAEGAAFPKLVKVLDLGMARPAAEDRANLTQLGQVLGTPDYISPEQGRDSTKADIRSDIYSLGCTLFKLLTGEPVFPGDNTVEKLLARMSRDARRARNLRPEVPAWLDQVIARMLARRPEDRYQTPAEVADALDPSVIHESSIAIPIPARAESIVIPENDAELRDFLSHFGEDTSESSDIDAAAVPCPLESAPSHTSLGSSVESSGVDTFAEGDTPVMILTRPELPPVAVIPAVQAPKAIRTSPGKARRTLAAEAKVDWRQQWKHPELWPQGPVLAVGLSIAAALLVALYLALPSQLTQGANDANVAGAAGFPMPRNPTAPEPGYIPWQGIPIAGMHALELDVEESGSYELALRVQEAPRGNARVLLDGRSIGGAVELQSSPAKPVVTLGQQRLAKGPHKLEVDLGGQRPVGVRFADWRIIGPFDNSRSQGFATSYPPEKDLDPSKSHIGKHGRELRWIDRPIEAGQMLDLTKVVEDHEQAVAYLQCVVVAERAGRIPLFLGSDDTLTVWLNGQTLLAKDGNRACVAYSDQIELDLKQGENRLLFKICQGNGLWGFWWSDQSPRSAEGLLRFGLHVRRTSK